LFPEELGPFSGENSLLPIEVTLFFGALEKFPKEQRKVPSGVMNFPQGRAQVP
jgi:hypothetical protein